MQLFTQATYAGAFQDVAQPFGTLRDLRAGNTNKAIEDLENRLDVGIIMLSSVLEEQSDQKKRAAYVRLLIKLRDYRAVHPWTSDLMEAREAVEDALANIPEGSVAK